MLSGGGWGAQGVYIHSILAMCDSEGSTRRGERGDDGGGQLAPPSTSCLLGSYLILWYMCEGILRNKRDELMVKSEGVLAE